MSTCTRWWLRHCLNCQAQKTPRLTARWPVILIALPPEPGIAMRVDYFGPLPATLWGSTYILFCAHRFSRRADMFAVTAAEFRAERTASVHSNRHNPLWACLRNIPRTMVSSSSPSFRTSPTSFLVFVKLPLAPIARVVTVLWSVSTIQRHKCWL